MGVTSEGDVARTRMPLRGGRGSAIGDAAQAAWLAVLPCAALTYLVVVGAGPWLGDHLRPQKPTFRYLVGPVDPRADAPAIGQFVASLTGPLLLALATAAIVRWRLRLPRALATAVVVLAQALLLFAIAACFQGQRRPAFGFTYFSLRTLAVSAIAAVSLLAACGSRRLRNLLGAHLREPRTRRLVIAAVAAAATAVWMLPALETDRSITWATSVIQYHTPFYLDETFAVVNGLTPLVTFTPQYGALWPYLVALPLVAFGRTMLVFTLAMATATSLALLAIFGVLRRVTHNSLAALLLYVPFLATTLFPIGENATSLMPLGAWFAFYPLRYAGPLLLAWLTARHLSDPGRRRPWPVFALAGLVALNNVDAGVAALGASLAALLWAAWPRTREAALALVANVVAGLAGAVAIVSAVTLARSGSLPHLGQLTEFARVFALNGYNAVPKPGVRGLPLLIYGTFAAAIATATVLALRRDRDVVLTGMLAWIGVFGLGSASYYVARDVLPTLFSPWALAIALLAVVAFRSLAAQRRPRQWAKALVPLFGLGVIACSIPTIPAPWTQLARLQHAPPNAPGGAGPVTPPSEPETRRFLVSLADGSHRFVVKGNAPVALLATNGHRIADAYGIRDVTPYTGVESILTAEQAERTLDILRAAGGNTVVMPQGNDVALDRLLVARGFAMVTERGLRRPHFREAHDTEAVMRLSPTRVHEYVKWVDTRHLHPRALR